MRNTFYYIFLCLFLATAACLHAQDLMTIYGSYKTTQIDSRTIDSLYFTDFNPNGDKVTAINISDTYIKLKPGETYQLSAEVLPADATNKTLSWSSGLYSPGDNEGSASVTPDGKVVALMWGHGRIWCSATDGSGITAECLVYVTNDSIQRDYGDFVSGTRWLSYNLGSTAANGQNGSGNFYKTTEADPVPAVMGKEWHTPNYTQISEFKNDGVVDYNTIYVAPGSDMYYATCESHGIELRADGYKKEGWFQPGDRSSGYCAYGNNGRYMWFKEGNSSLEYDTTIMVKIRPCSRYYTINKTKSYIQEPNLNANEDGYPWRQGYEFKEYAYMYDGNECFHARGARAGTWQLDSLTGKIDKCKSYQLYQYFTLPAGTYCLVNYSFYRDGADANTNPGKSMCRLFADTTSIAIKTLGSEKHSRYPTTVSEADSCFQEDWYCNTLFFTVPKTKSVTIGLRGTFDSPLSWCVTGRFELYQIADSVPAEEGKVSRIRLNIDYDEDINGGMLVGDHGLCQAKVTPVTAYDKSVAWRSDDASVVSINQYGEMTAVSAGSTFIRCYALDGSGVMKSAQITVLEHPIFQNADLSNRLTGWTASNFNIPVASTDAKAYATEAYAGFQYPDVTSYSLLQNIKLHEGKYRLTCNAFFRYGDAYDTDSSISQAKLFAGTDSVEIKTLGSESLSTYPNTQKEAATAFSEGKYLNTLEFEVNYNYATNGIPIGITGTFDTLKSWCACGPFTLTLIKYYLYP